MTTDPLAGLAEAQRAVIDAIESPAQRFAVLHHLNAGRVDAALFIAALDASIFAHRDEAMAAAYILGAAAAQD